MRAVHAGAGNVEVLALVGEHEAEALGTDGQAARDEVRELDRRVLLAPDPHDLPPALEQVELLAEGLLLGLANAEGLDEVPEGKDPGALLPQALEDFGIARQHAAGVYPQAACAAGRLPRREALRREAPVRPWAARWA